MGSDIHGGFIKVTGGFENEGVLTKVAVETSYKFDRDYTLFAILAGVRNGYGFGGCYRHEPLQPIAPDRGLPDFLEVVDECTDDLYNKWYGASWNTDGEEKEFGEWLGDHSYTYMTVKEILEWDFWESKLQQGGVVSKEHYYETIAKGKTPERWCGGVSGGNTLVAGSPADLLVGEMVHDKYTHVKCSWKDEMTLGERMSYFLDEVKRITKEYGEDTYLVIGFDS